MNTRRLLAPLIAVLALSACAQGPEVTWARAQQARRDRDVAAYLACFTAKSRAVLANLDAFQASTRKDLTWLKDPFVLLPDASPTQPPKIDGNVALLRVGSARHEFEAVLVREGGQWHIEALELPTFWAHLTATKESE